MVHPVEKLIDDKGGPEGLANAGVMSLGYARVCRSRKRLPRTVWPDIMRAFPDVTLDVLLEVERAA